MRFLHEGLDKIKNIGGARLKAFIKCIAEQDVPDINVGNISSRTSQIALFDFRAFLNVAMLLVESKNAKVQKCLDKLKLDIFNSISIYICIDYRRFE